jgi:hypothetical protein
MWGRAVGKRGVMGGVVCDLFSLCEMKLRLREIDNIVRVC